MTPRILDTPAARLAAWLLPAIALAASFAAAPASAQSPPKAATDAGLSATMDCAALVTLDFTRLEAAPSTILSAKLTPAAGGTPEYCDVKGTVQPQVQFELRMSAATTLRGRRLHEGPGAGRRHYHVVSVPDAGRRVGMAPAA